MSIFTHSDRVEPLVGFKNNFDDNDLYYFDFNNYTWKGCKPIGKLPYNLWQYQDINSDHKFITCPDSYCLTDNMENVLSNDEMIKEKEWRDSIVKPQEEVDVFVFLSYTVENSNKTLATYIELQKDIYTGFVVFYI